MTTSFQSSAQQRRVFVPIEFNDSIVNNPIFIEFFNNKVYKYNIQFYVSRADHILSLARDIQIAKDLENFEFDCIEMCHRIQNATRIIQRCFREARYNPTYTLCQNVMKRYYDESNM
jgi:hypothetical protein